MNQELIRALAELLRVMVRRVCDEFKRTEIPLRPWTRWIPLERGHAEQRVERRADYYALVETITMQNWSLFREVVELVQSHYELAKAAHVDPTPDHDGFRNVLVGLVAPLLQAYFEKTQAIRFDEEALTEVLGEVISELRTQEIPLTWLSVLTNVRLDAERIELNGGFGLRQVAAGDVERWLNGRTPPVSVFNPHLFEAAIEETLKKRRDESAPRVGGTDRAWRTVTALRLLAEADVPIVIPFTEHLSRGILWRYWFGGGFGFAPAHVLIAEPLVLDAGKAVGLKRIWTLLEASPNAGRLSLAIRRWDSASERLRNDDKLVDYWIALESLFTSDSREEIQYRASIRMAVFLGATAEERLSMRDGVRRSYGMRSNIVHGQSVKPAQLSDVTNWTRAHLRKALVKMLELETPFDPKSIDDSLLSR